MPMGIAKKVATTPTGDLSLGVSGDAWPAFRVGLRDGTRSDSVETPRDQECLAWAGTGCGGWWRIVRPIVAAPWAYVWTRDRFSHLSPAHLSRAPRTEASAQQDSPCPVSGETGRTKEKRPAAGMDNASCAKSRSIQRWTGPRGGPKVCRGAFESLAQQHAQSYAAAQARKTKAMAAHVRQVHAVRGMPGSSLVLP